MQSHEPQSDGEFSREKRFETLVRARLRQRPPAPGETADDHRTRVLKLTAELVTRNPNLLSLPNLRKEVNRALEARPLRRR